MLARSSHGTAWNYLTVQLNRLSEDEAGDPDLYGMFYGGTDVRMIGHPIPVLRRPAIYFARWKSAEDLGAFTRSLTLV